MFKYNDVRGVMYGVCCAAMVMCGGVSGMIAGMTEVEKSRYEILPEMRSEKLFLRAIKSPDWLFNEEYATSEAICQLQSVLYKISVTKQNVATLYDLIDEMITIDGLEILLGERFQDIERIYDHVNRRLLELAIGRGESGSFCIYGIHQDNDVDSLLYDGERIPPHILSKINAYISAVSVFKNDLEKSPNHSISIDVKRILDKHRRNMPNINCLSWAVETAIADQSQKD
jgi:hypothetical protein